MRVQFVEAIHKILREDPASILISGDLGYNAFEDILKENSKQFLNAGILEQSMIGIAAGAAIAGARPWVYSIIPFVTYRCLEQIRNDLCFHNLPVRIVGNGAGFTYGIMGSTHHALEDLGVMKCLPNMTLFFPIGNDQVSTVVDQINRLQGPSYLRLGVSPYTSTRKPLSENPLTLTRHYQRGDSLTLIGVGHAAQIALSALELEPRIQGIDYFTVSKCPFDLISDSALCESVRKTGRVLVIEEHYQVGGIAESLRMELPHSEFEIIAPRYSFNNTFGTPLFLLKQAGIDAESLAYRILTLLEGTKIK